MQRHHQCALPAVLPDVFPQNALRRVFEFDRAEELYQELAAESTDSFFDRLLARINVHPQVSGGDLDRIPKTGPVVLVANHPFGFLEGAILSVLLKVVRPDVKIMANSLLSYFPAIRDRFIFVNPFGTEEAKRENLQGLRESIAHLRSGGLLVVFPAGEVAHVNLREQAITDPPWSETIARIIRITNAATVPAYFSGANSPAFHLLGMLHPRLRTAMLPHEFFNKQDREIEVRIGSVVPNAKLAGFGSDQRAIEHLRDRTYLLRHRKMGSLCRKNAGRQQPLVAPVESALMEADLARLAPDRKLDEMGSTSVYYASAHEIPHILREIGRLREVTFRLAGEGTGKPIDLDAFDSHYLQLFLWNHQSRELVGAYRIGPTDVIAKHFGHRGLYTSTLFDYRPEFLDRVGTALELGRSFVRREYQKSFTPLLLLWKGIAGYVAKNPRYKTLFGPVSISNDYQPVSRQLMVTYFAQQCAGNAWSTLVKARSPFRTKPVDALDAIREWDLEDLSTAIADLETDQKGIPILLRQYLKLGGELLEFNVDRDFSDALDGLILVDLTRTDEKMLQRYMGKENARRFFAWHRRKEERGSPQQTAA